MYPHRLHMREESSLSLTRTMGALALACGALTACASTSDAGPDVACDRDRRADTSQDSSPDRPRTAGFALASLFPSGMLDAVLVTLATLSLVHQDEHDDDFLAAFGHRVLSGRGAN